MSVKVEEVWKELFGLNSEDDAKGCTAKEANGATGVKV